MISNGVLVTNMSQGDKFAINVKDQGSVVQRQQICNICDVLAMPQGQICVVLARVVQKRLQA